MEQAAFLEALPDFRLEFTSVRESRCFVIVVPGRPQTTALGPGEHLLAHWVSQLLRGKYNPSMNVKCPKSY
jgi:hypothetical protein